MTRAVTRSLQLIEALAGSPVPLTSLEAASRSGLARVATQRLLTSLVEEGFLRRNPADGTYTSTAQLWKVGAAVINGVPVREIALPHLVEMATVLHNWVTLSFLDGDQVAFTDRVEAVGDRVYPHIVSIRLHPLPSGAGRILAAYQPVDVQERLIATVPRLTPYTTTDPEALREDLERCRARGYSLVQREHDSNVSGLGFPLFDERGRAVAAVGVPVWGPAQSEMVNMILAAGRRTAERISAALGYRHRFEAPVV